MAIKHSLDFGKKEKVLNYACQTYQLSRPNKVGEVMALIRECQPQSYTEWENGILVMPILHVKIQLITRKLPVML